MPSSSSTGRAGRPTVLLLVALAIFTASLPAATVTGRTAASVGTGATASGVASDRATCLQDTESTGARRIPRNTTRSPIPNETEDLTVARGDVAIVPLSIPARANVTVTVGSGDGYAARLSVRDDGDGRVTLLVNTYLVGNRTTVAPGAYQTRGEDTVTVTGVKTTAPLYPGTYSIAVRRNGNAIEERQLTVTDPEFEGVTTRRAVPRLFDAPNASAVRSANRSGLVRPLQPGEHGPEVVSSETLLVRIDASSLLGVIAAQPGNTTTERFLALHDETEPKTNETFTITGPCGGILFPDTVAEGAGRVLLDYRAGAVYVLLDTDDLEGVDAGDQTVYVEVAPESRLNDAERERQLTTEFRFGERRTVIRPADADTVRLTATDRAAITGETNLLPGSRVTVRVESRVAPTFERRATTTVGENGTFTATVDLENASTPGLFAVEIGNSQFPGEIGDPPNVHWQLRRLRTVEPITDFVLERLDLPDGNGFLVAYRYDPATERLRPVGSATVSDAELVVEPLRDPQHLLVVAHRDVNGNNVFDGPAKDAPYRVDGRAVRDWVNVSVGGVAPDAEEPPATFDADRVSMPTTERRSTTPDTTTTPTTSSTTRSDDSDVTSVPASRMGGEAESTDADIPGFGSLVGLIALVGATALLLSRRR